MPKYVILVSEEKPRNGQMGFWLTGNFSPSFSCLSGQIFTKDRRLPNTIMKSWQFPCNSLGMDHKLSMIFRFHTHTENIWAAALPS